MASVLVRIIDSNGNFIEESEVDEHQIEIYRSYGYTINLVDNNSLPTTPEPEPEPTQQPAQLSPEVQQIFDGIFELQITIPDWFRQNNMNYVLNGQITNEEFLNSYNALVNTGVITIAGIPAPIPAPIPTPTPAPTPTPTPVQLSPEVQQIFDSIFEGTIIVPDWFRQNNMNYVKDGLITNQDFLNGYHSLVDTGVITIAGIPTPTPTPTEPDESQVNYPMVTQNANTFMITENDRVTGNIVFDKIESNWNTYYDDRNLIAWFQLKDPVTNANVSSQIPTKSNIVKFPISTEGFVNPLDRIQTITIDESAMGYKKLKVELFLFTDDDIAVAEPLRFPISQTVCTDCKPKQKRDDFIGKVTALTVGGLALSLLLSGAKK